nr:hypothetical protein CFP56_26752 [Quercus suber]
MANIEDLWSRFSLTKEEEHGANVPWKKEVTIVHLAATFFPKRVVGDNILLFEFDDAMDLERVLEFELWSYDKSIIVLRRAVDVKSAPSLDFDSMTFWENSTMSRTSVLLRQWGR